MKRKKKKMEETPVPPVMDPIKDVGDQSSNIQMRIERSEDGQTLTVYLRAPKLAEVIRKMTPGNYRKSSYAAEYLPILAEVPGSNGANIITRPAITRITRHFVAGTDFDFNEAPRPALLANPDLLAAGFTLTHKVDKPIPPDVVKKWGKRVMEGCTDILTNAKPFRMSWVMSETK